MKIRLYELLHALSHSQRFLIIISVIIFLCFVGLPTFYLTTGAYRTTLPHSRIVKNIEHFKQHIKSQSFQNSLLPHLHFEQSCLDEFSQSTQHEDSGEIFRVECTSKLPKLRSQEPYHIELYPNQTIVFSSKSKMSTSQIKNLIHRDLLSPLFSFDSLISNNPFQRQTHTQQHLKQLKKVNLYLINLDPSLDHPSIVLNWPEPNAYKNWSFVKEMNSIFGELDVQFETLYFGRIPDSSDQSSNDELRISARDLQYFINENDFPFQKPTDPDHQLNFLILVTPQLKNITVVDYYGRESDFDGSHVVSQWGGATFFFEKHLSTSHLPKWTQYRSNYESPQAPLHLQLDERELHWFFELFVAQFRKLIGMESLHDLKNYLVEESVTIRSGDENSHGLYEWERNRFLRQKCIEFLEETVQSLEALIRVVQGMPDVMVMESVRELVDVSLESFEGAVSEQWSWLKRCFEARRSFESAELAFHHPSMISLLYFPDSQKLAIYLPFVLPVTITVIVAFFREVRFHVKKLRDVPEENSSE